MEKKSFIISGPTASGKSDFAHSLAMQTGGTIINADSVQMVKGIETISAAPTPVDDVNYELYSILEVGEKMSAGRYAELAASAAEHAEVPIFVGGTGFYLSALVHGFSALPEVSKKSRAAAVATPNKHEVLKKCDPELAARLHPNDTQRLSRALEVFIETSVPLSVWQKSKRTPSLPFVPKKIAILPPRETLLERARIRRKKMIEHGAIDEVRANIDADIKANGFREIAAMLRGEISMPEMMRLWEINDAQYIKRQFTWLRHQFNADIVIDHIPTIKDIDDVI